MPITPAGDPAWVRSVGITDYSGNTSKQNYMNVGAIDALTDCSAEEFCRATADLVACVRVAPFFVGTYLCNDGSPAAPTVESVLMQTGVRTTSYAGDSAPTGFPAAARNGAGDVTFTFDSSYDDEYGVAGAFTPVHAKGTAHDTTHATVTTVISGQTVRVRVFDDAGAAVADARVTLEVS
jgi:hypothetical protein